MKNDSFFRGMDNWLNSKQASEYLGISENNLRVKVCRGQLIPCYLGRRYRFKKSYLDALITGKRVELCRLKER